MTASVVTKPRKPRRYGPARPVRPAWEEKPTWAGQALKTLTLTLVVLAVLVPMWSVVVTSLSSTATINAAGGMVFVPRGFDPSAYVAIFSRGQISQAVWISTLITVGGTAFSLVLTVLAAYGLSRPGSVAHRTLLFWFLLTVLIYPGMIPSYLVVTGLGLKDSLLALIVPSAISAFNLVVIRAFFMNIPAELTDSARIDGAGDLRILWSVVLPLSKAVTAVVGLFYAVGYWNAFFNAMLFINSNDKEPIQRVMQRLILMGQAPQNMPSGVSVPGMGYVVPPSLAIKMAVVVVTVLPLVLVYPFVQKHFTKGVIIGAIKG